MKAIFGILFGFGVTLAVAIGGRMGADSDAMTVILGVFTGFVLSVVMVLLFGALHRVNENMTRRNISSIRVQATQAGGSGLVLDRGAYLPIPKNTRPRMGNSGVSERPQAALPVYVPHPGPTIDGEAHELFQFRRYGYEVPTKTRRYRRNLLGDAAAGAPYVETLTPNREMNLRSDVGVPIGQSLFSGLVAALVAALVSWKLGGDVLSWTIAGFVLGMAVCWVAALGLARSLVWKIERFTGQDLDGDGEQGEPEDAHTLLIQPGEARQTAQRHERSREKAQRCADLLAFAQRCNQVGPSERAQGIRSGTPAQEDYRVKRDLLLQLGIARWKSDTNHNLGWALTVTPNEAAEIIRHHVMDVSST